MVSKSDKKTNDNRNTNKANTPKGTSPTETQAREGSKASDDGKLDDRADRKSGKNK
jgi:hypothetical protein